MILESAKTMWAEENIQMLESKCFGAMLCVAFETKGITQCLIV